MNTRQEVRIMITDDVIFEPNQDFTSQLQLTTAEAGVEIRPDITNIVILDNDSKYTVVSWVASCFKRVSHISATLAVA